VTIEYAEDQIEAKPPCPGERVQTWWCEGCESWHTGSVLGGPVVEHGDDERAVNAQGRVG
jgi:hypothetical protein